MQLKALALATTSLVIFGLSATAANAKSGMTGIVTLGTGHTWQDFDEGGEADLDDQFMNVFGGGQVNIPCSDSCNVQVDVNGDAAYGNEDDQDNFGTAINVGAHINYSNEQGFLGVFAATGRVSSFDNDTTSFFAAGLEGQYTGATWLAGAQIGWIDSCCNQDAGNDDDFLHDAGFVRVNGTWFVTNRLAIGVSGAYIDGIQDSSDDVRQWEWTATAEKMIGKNTSLFIQYRGVTAEDDDDGFDHQAHAANIGFRFHLNATDLYTSAVDGPSAPALGFGRWVSELGEQMED